MSLLVIYLLSNWPPTVVKSTGMSLMEASVATAMVHVGGTVGAITFGQTMDRFEPSRVLAAAYLLAAVFAALVGSSLGNWAALMLSVFGAGFCVSGGQVERTHSLLRTTRLQVAPQVLAGHLASAGLARSSAQSQADGCFRSALGFRSCLRSWGSLRSSPASACWPWGRHPCAEDWLSGSADQRKRALISNQRCMR